MGRRTIKPHNSDAVKEIIELKAHAYDVISAIEQLQRELAAVNQQIAQKTAEYNEAMKSTDHDG